MEARGFEYGDHVRAVLLAAGLDAQLQHHLADLQALTVPRGADPPLAGAAAAGPGAAPAAAALTMCTLTEDGSMTWCLARRPGDGGDVTDAIATVRAAVDGLPGVQTGRIHVDMVSGLTATEVCERLAAAASPELIGLDEFARLLGVERPEFDRLRDEDPALPRAVRQGLWRRDAAQRYTAAGTGPTG